MEEGDETRILSSLGRDLLPVAHEGTILDDLELEKRTYNCLALHWPSCKRDLQVLDSKTLGQLIKLPGFGSKCLVDFLSALEMLQATKNDRESENLSEISTPKDDGTEFSEETFHDPLLGLLLGGVDEAADALRVRMHRIAWLLHCGYDQENREIGAHEMAEVWRSLDELMQSATALETLIAAAESGQAFVPVLAERLTGVVTKVAPQIAALPDINQRNMWEDPNFDWNRTANEIKPQKIDRRRKVDWENVEWMRDGKPRPFPEIAEEVGCTRQAVYNAAKQYGIENPMYKKRKF